MGKVNKFRVHELYNAINQHVELCQGQLQWQAEQLFLDAWQAYYVTKRIVRYYVSSYVTLVCEVCQPDLTYWRSNTNKNNKIWSRNLWPLQKIVPFASPQFKSTHDAGRPQIKVIKQVYGCSYVTNYFKMWN